MLEMATVRRPSEQQSTLEGGFQEPVKRVPSLPPKKCKDIQTGNVNCSDSMLQKGPKFGCLYPNCGQNFDKPSALSVHMLSHRCGKPFVCSHKGCNRSFSQATTLEKHEISHQKGTEPRRMLNSSVLNSFTCPQRECGQQFTSRSSLQIHIRSTHAVSVSKGPGGKDLNQQKSVPIESPVSSSKTSKKQFACKHSGCNQSFDHGLALRAHLAAGAPGLAAETAYYQSLLRGLVRALGRLGGRSPALAAVLGHLPAYAQAKNAVDTMLPMPMPTSVPSNKRQRSPVAPATDPPLKAPSNEDSGQTTSENSPENANAFPPDPSTPLTVSAQSTLRAHAQQQLEGSSAASDSEEEEDEEEEDLEPVTPAASRGVSLSGAVEAQLTGALLAGPGPCPRAEAAAAPAAPAPAGTVHSSAASAGFVRGGGACPRAAAPSSSRFSPPRPSAASAGMMRGWLARASSDSEGGAASGGGGGGPRPAKRKAEAAGLPAGGAEGRAGATVGPAGAAAAAAGAEVAAFLARAQANGFGGERLQAFMASALAGTGLALPAEAAAGGGAAGAPGAEGGGLLLGGGDGTPVVCPF